MRESMSKEDFGPFFHEQRLRKSVTAPEVARHIDVHPSFVRGIERGTQFPSAATASAMLRAIGLPARCVNNKVYIGDDFVATFTAAVRGQTRTVHSRQPRVVTILSWS